MPRPPQIRPRPWPTRSRRPDPAPAPCLHRLPASAPPSRASESTSFTFGPGRSDPGLGRGGRSCPPRLLLLPLPLLLHGDAEGLEGQGLSAPRHAPRWDRGAGQAGRVRQGRRTALGEAWGAVRANKGLARWAYGAEGQRAVWGQERGCPRRSSCVTCECQQKRTGQEPWPPPEVSACSPGPARGQHWDPLQIQSHWRRDPAWHRLRQPELES